MKDGFFDGELLDGRHGLVPSNFVQKLVGEDLLEFHQAVVQGLRDGDDSASTNIAHDLAQEAVALMGQLQRYYAVYDCTTKFSFCIFIIYFCCVKPAVAKYVTSACICVSQ